ncbi:hypothetical protein HK102_000822 [Quaeritorhiza haematococci]|nr:hypothetical protein HK102_000822 [Quaeritorhiza haematococci]
MTSPPSAPPPGTKVAATSASSASTLAPTTMHSPRLTDLLNRAAAVKHKQEHSLSNGSAKGDEDAHLNNGDLLLFVRGHSAKLGGRVQAMKTVRLFLTGTQDTTLERNALTSTARLFLDQLCRNLKFDFQLLDIHCDLSKEVASSTLTSNTWVSDTSFSHIELERCFDVSCGPAFACVLGDKLGPPILPERIPLNEWESIITVLDTSSSRSKEGIVNGDENHHGIEHCVELLEKWYTRDDTVQPSCYVLDAWERHLPDFFSDDPARRAAACHECDQILQELCRALSKAATLVSGDSSFTPRSLVEMELSQAYSDSLTKPNSFFCFVSQDSTVDKRLSKLRTTIPISGSFRRDNLENHDDIKDSDHLTNICEHFCYTIGQAILDVYSSQTSSASAHAHIANIEGHEELLAEVALHSRFANDQCASFVGLDDIVTRLADFLVGDDNFGLVTGPRGGGKSSLIAEAIELARDSLRHATIVYRFVNLTSASSDARSLLRSICSQIKAVYGSDDHFRQNRHKSLVPHSYAELTRFFWTCLGEASALAPLVIFIDGVEGLMNDSALLDVDSHDHIRSLPGGGGEGELSRESVLAWLPPTLPPFVKIVLSVISEDAEPNTNGERATRRDASTLESVLNFRIPDLILPVYGFTGETDVDNFIQRYHNERRPPAAFLDANSPLYDVVKKKCLAVRLPLHCWLYCTIVELRLRKRHQNPFQPESPSSPSTSEAKGANHTGNAAVARYEDKLIAFVSSLSDTIAELFNILLEEVEDIYGVELVSRSLCYATLAKTGLSLSQMLDVLSCDDKLLDDVFERFGEPPFTRFPPHLWLRLYTDLNGNRFLPERATSDADGRLVYVPNPSFEDAIVRRYLCNPRSRQHCQIEIHSALADFFQGRWSAEPKPIRTSDVGLPVAVTSSSFSPSPSEELWRYILPEPNVYHSGAPNSVKLRSLWFHLMKSGRLTELLETVASVQYVDAAVRCMEVRDVIGILQVVADADDAATGVVPRKSGINNGVKVKGDENDGEARTRRSLVLEMMELLKRDTDFLGSQPDLFLQRAMHQPPSSLLVKAAAEYLQKQGSTDSSTAESQSGWGWTKPPLLCVEWTNRCQKWSSREPALESSSSPPSSSSLPIAQTIELPDPRFDMTYAAADVHGDFIACVVPPSDRFSTGVSPNSKYLKPSTTSTYSDARLAVWRIGDGHLLHSESCGWSRRREGSLMLPPQTVQTLSRKLQEGGGGSCSPFWDATPVCVFDKYGERLAVAFGGNVHIYQCRSLDTNGDVFDSSAASDLAANGTMTSTSTSNTQNGSTELVNGHKSRARARSSLKLTKKGVLNYGAKEGSRVDSEYIATSVVGLRWIAPDQLLVVTAPHLTVGDLLEDASVDTSTSTFWSTLTSGKTDALGEVSVWDTTTCTKLQVVSRLEDGRIFRGFLTPAYPTTPTEIAVILWSLRTRSLEVVAAKAELKKVDAPPHWRVLGVSSCLWGAQLQALVHDEHTDELLILSDAGRSNEHVEAILHIPTPSNPSGATNPHFQPQCDITGRRRRVYSGTVSPDGKFAAVSLRHSTLFWDLRVLFHDKEALAKEVEVGITPEHPIVLMPRTQPTYLTRGGGKEVLSFSDDGTAVVGRSIGRRKPYAVSVRRFQLDPCETGVRWAGGFKHPWRVWEMRDWSRGVKMTSSDDERMVLCDANGGVWLADTRHGGFDADIDVVNVDDAVRSGNRENAAVSLTSTSSREQVGHTPLLVSKSTTWIHETWLKDGYHRPCHKYPWALHPTEPLLLLNAGRGNNETRFEVRCFEKRSRGYIKSSMSGTAKPEDEDRSRESVDAITSAHTTTPIALVQCTTVGRPLCCAFAEASNLQQYVDEDNSQRKLTVGIADEGGNIYIYDIHSFANTAAAEVTSPSSSLRTSFSCPGRPIGLSFCPKKPRVGILDETGNVYVWDYAVDAAEKQSDKKTTSGLQAKVLAAYSATHLSWHPTIPSLLLVGYLRGILQVLDFDQCQALTLSNETTRIVGTNMDLSSRKSYLPESVDEVTLLDAVWFDLENGNDPGSHIAALFSTRHLCVWDSTVGALLARVDLALNVPSLRGPAAFLGVRREEVCGDDLRVAVCVQDLEDDCNGTVVDPLCGKDIVIMALQNLKKHVELFGLLDGTDPYQDEGGATSTPIQMVHMGSVNGGGGAKIKKRVKFDDLTLMVPSQELLEYYILSFDAFPGGLVSQKYQVFVTLHSRIQPLPSLPVASMEEEAVNPDASNKRPLPPLWPKQALKFTIGNCQQCKGWAHERGRILSVNEQEAVIAAGNMEMKIGTLENVEPETLLYVRLGALMAKQDQIDIHDIFWVSDLALKPLEDLEPDGDSEADENKETEEGDQCIEDNAMAIKIGSQIMAVSFISLITGGYALAFPVGGDQQVDIGQHRGDMSPQSAQILDDVRAAQSKKIPTPTPNKKVPTPTPTKKPSMAEAEIAQSKKVPTPILTKKVPTPTPTKKPSVAEAEVAQTKKIPTPTKKVPTPAPTKKVPTPTPTKKVPAPTPTKKPVQ